MDGNADRDQAKEVCDSLAKLPVGEGWLWAPDHNLLKRERFPAITTLDTSKTPKAGDKRIAAPVLASADIANITRQIEAIQTAMTTGEKKAPAKAVLQTAAPAVPAAKKRAVGQKVGERPEAFVALEPKLIGRMVATARQAAGLSQAELAARAEMAQPNIVRLEKGQALPSTTTLSRVAAATGNRLKIVFRRQTE